jgi:hypothetical protein
MMVRLFFNDLRLNELLTQKTNAVGQRRLAITVAVTVRLVNS